jgi:excisionase family DNA binding protein
MSDPLDGERVMLAELPPVLTVDEARRVLRIGRRQLYQAIARHDVPALRVGRTIRIPRSGLELWLSQQPEGRGPIL